MKVIHSILSFSPSIALSQAIVCILLAFSPAAYSKNINPRKAAKIAQRYVTLPQSQEVKAKSKGFSQTADTPYYIYNDARGSGFVIVSGDDEMGEIEGKEIELGNPQGPVYYLKRKGDLLAISQDTSTGIGASVNAAPSIDVRLESHQISVSCSGLRNIKLYQISGCLLKQSEKINGNQASLSLQGIPAGIYLLRIVTDKLTFTYLVAKK